MPRFYRRRGYSRTYRRSRWPYRSWRRSSLRNSSQAGRRRFNVSVPTQDAFSMTVTAPAQGAAYWTELHAVSPYAFDTSITAALRNLTHGALLSSTLYRTYAKLYDQVKVNSVYVKLSVMTNVGQGGVTPAIRIVTSWDRAAGYDEINNEESYPTITDIQDGSESQVSMVVNNSRAIISRYCKASDLQERCTFHDCSYVHYGHQYSDAVYDSDKGQVGFCPALFFAINCATSPAAGQSFVFNVQADVRWNVTFRNPKYGLSAEGSGSKFEDLKSDAVEEVKTETPVEVSETVVKDGAKKFDALSDEEKAKIMELIGSMDDEKEAT